MDPKTEAGLYRALEDMIRTVNSGEHPTAALVKVASAHGLNDSFTRLLGQSYNSSRSIAHHQTYSGQDRCTPFQLANPDEAIATVFTTNAKTAGERFTLSQIRSKQHLVEPGRHPNFFDRALKLAAVHDAEATTEKVASEQTPPEPTAEELYVKQQAKLASIRQARRDAETAEAQLLTALDAASHDIRQNLYAMPFDVLEQALVARYDMDQGVKLANILYESIDGKKLRQKRAASFERSVFDYNLNPFAAIDRFVLAAIAATSSAEKLAAIQEDAATVPFGQSPSSSNKSMGLLPWDEAKLAAAFPSLTGKIMGLIPPADDGQVNADKEFENQLDQMSGSSQNTQLRNIRVQAMLKELLDTDPVISTYSPDEVVDRYNELVQVAPHLADKTIAIRGILRRALQQGNVDPFEVGQYLSMNKTQQEQNTADNSVLQAAASTSDVLRKGNNTYQRSKDNKEDAYRNAMLSKPTGNNPPASGAAGGKPPTNPQAPRNTAAQPPALPAPAEQGAVEEPVITIPETRSDVPAASLEAGIPNATLPRMMRRVGG